MKKWTLACLAGMIMFIAPAHSQKAREPEFPEKVASVDSIIANLYGVISGEKGEERNWDLFRYLFHPEAKLIPSRKREEGGYLARYLTVEAYIESSGSWLVENGFFEKEIHRVEERFGPMVHMFSTYESFHSEQDEQPFTRGINSIQLLHDGDRWWIINIFWASESNEHRIPDQYLKSP